jgi:hypothetical protein
MNENQTKLTELFTIFRNHDLELPSGLEASLVACCPSKGRIRITQHPVLHFTLDLAQGWKDRLKTETDLARLAAWLIILLTSQVQGRPKDKHLFDLVSLAARRLFLLCSQQMAFLRHDFRAERLRLDGALPVPSLSSGTVFSKDATEDAVEGFLAACLRLQRDVRAKRHRDESDLGDFESFPIPACLSGDDVQLRGDQPEIFQTNDAAFFGKKALCLRESSAQTQMLSGANIFQAIAVQWFRAWVNGKSLGLRDDDELFHGLGWMVGMFLGIPFRDFLDLDLRDDGSSKLGGISPEGLRLNIASGYYPSSVCWVKDVLSLPIPQHMREVLRELIRRFPTARRVRDFYRGFISPMDAHRTFCKKTIGIHLPGYKTKAIRIDRYWYRTALLQCDLPASIVGILRGHPVGGARGESAYLSVCHHVLVDAALRIQRHIYRQAGGDFLEEAFTSAEPKKLYGKKAMALGDFCETTLSHIEASAPRYNDLIACLVRVCRGLGFRRRNATQNPVYLLRDEPIDLLLILDKVAGDWAPHVVAEVRVLQDIICVKSPGFLRSHPGLRDNFHQLLKVTLQLFWACAFRDLGARFIPRKVGGAY